MTRLLFSLRSRLSTAIWAAVLPAGVLCVGCETERGEESVGEWAQPAPSHYRDFPNADSLSSYLRLSATPLVGAHRGGAVGRFPENAIETFAQSLTHGPVLLETDVRMTKDSVLVLMHDETLDRTTTGSGAVRAATLSELRMLRLIAGSEDTTRYQVPTLAEALAWAEGRAVLQLDVKDDVPRSLLAAVLRRMEALDQAIVITYTLADARWYHQRMPDLLLSVSTETREEAVAHVEQIEESRLVGFAGVGAPSQEVMSFLSSRNIPVTIGTFGELDRRARQEGLSVYRELFTQGVDIVATDEVALASQAVATYEPETVGASAP